MNESIILRIVLSFLRGALQGALTALVIVLLAFVLNAAMKMMRLIVGKIEELRKDK